MSHEKSDIDEGMFGLLGGGMAVVQAVALTFVGISALDSLAYGAIAGIFNGVGTYLFIPWFIGLQNSGADAAEEMSLSELVEHGDGNAQLGVLGFGLDMAGVVMFATGFVLAEPDLLVGTGTAIAVTLVVYLVGSVFFDL